MYQPKKDDKDVLGQSGQPLKDQLGEFTNFPDWDNPEDAPEGYYTEEDDAADEDDDDDDTYVPDEDDPDYDLSEAAGYSGWDAPSQRGPMPDWVITTIAVVLIFAIVLGIISVIR
jgi:hypothetical protein